MADDSDNNENKIDMKNHHSNNDRASSSRMAKSGGSIVDISDTPDVAVWAKEARRKGGIDTVKESSKILSIATKSTTDGKLVDPANKKDVAASMTDNDVPLTDEANISKKNNNDAR